MPDMTAREVQIVVLQLEERRRELDMLLEDVRAKFDLDEAPASKPGPAERRRTAKAALTGSRDPRRSPRWLQNVRWAGACASCGGEIPAGPITDVANGVYYVPGSNSKSVMYHGACAHRAGVVTP